MRLASWFLLLIVAEGFNFDQFFGGGRQQQQQEQRADFSYEKEQLNANCDKYLCPNTFECVKSPVHCSCPFPSSQTKCILPDKKNFVCIPKVSRQDLIRNDHDNGKGIEIRDCKWVEKAWKGLV